MSVNHNRLFVESYYKGDPVAALAAIRATYEAEEDLSGVTGCNYGSHPFERREVPAYVAGQNIVTHVHHCPDCGADYYASDPCWCTPGEPVALGRRAVREISALIERLVDSPPIEWDETRVEYDAKLDAWRIRRSEALTEIGNIIRREKDAAAHQSDAGEPEHGQQQPPADPPD